MSLSIREVCIMGYVTNTKFYLHGGRGGGEAQVIMRYHLHREKQVISSNGLLDDSF